MADYRVTAPCYRFMSEIEYDQFAEAAPTSGVPGAFSCTLSPWLTD